MAADSDRHLARFERVSPLTLSMGTAASLGIALVIEKGLSSKVKDQQVERLGHGPSLDEDVTLIEGFNNKRVRNFVVHLDTVRLPTSYRPPQMSCFQCPDGFVRFH